MEPCPLARGGQSLSHWSTRGGPLGDTVTPNLKKPVNRDRAGLHVSSQEGNTETLPAARGWGPPCLPQDALPVITALTDPQTSRRRCCLAPVRCRVPPPPEVLSCFPPSHPCSSSQPEPHSCPTTSTLAGPGLSPQRPPAWPGLPVRPAQLLAHSRHSADMRDGPGAQHCLPVIGESGHLYAAPLVPPNSLAYLTIFCLSLPIISEMTALELYHLEEMLRCDHHFLIKSEFLETVHILN